MRLRGHRPAADKTSDNGPHTLPTTSAFGSHHDGDAAGRRSRLCCHAGARRGHPPAGQPFRRLRQGERPAVLSLTNLNECRALEGVGPMVLPSNFSSLSAGDQQFVVIDLERVNRGLAPIVGLSASLNALAAKGAAVDDDPAYPTNGFVGAGALWAGASSPLGADYEWMYDDGPNGFDANADCPSSGGHYCWMHRDIILWKGTGGPLVAGAGASAGNGMGSYAFEVVSGYSTAGLTFTWAHELRYFAVKPGVEPVGKAAQAAARRRRKRARKHHPAVFTPSSGGSSSSNGSISITVG